MGPPSRVGVMIEFGLSKLSFNFDPSILCPNPKDLHEDNACRLAHVSSLFPYIFWSYRTDKNVILDNLIFTGRSRKDNVSWMSKKNWKILRKDSKRYERRN